MATTNRQILFILQMRNQAQGAINQFAGGMRQAAAAITAATQAANAFNTQVQAAGGSLNNLAAAANQAATNIRNAFNQTGTGAGRAGQQTNALIGYMRTLLSVSAATASVKVMANFQQQMATMQAVTGASAADMARASDAAQKLGATTQYTANQASEAMTVFAKAGFSVGDAITATTATLNLATVGQLSLSDAATTAMNVMNQFGLSAQNVGQIVDILAKTDNMSALSVKDLAASFQYSGSVAKEAGVSINTMAGAFAVLADAGTRGSRAGTEMQDIISRMIKPTAQAEVQIKQLGLSVQDLDSTDLVGTFQKLREAGMTTAQALAIFGQQGGRAALALAANIPKLKEYEAATKSAGGTAAQVASTLGNTLAGSFKKLVAQVQDVIVALSESGLLQVMTSIVDAARAVVAVAVDMAQALEHSSAGVQIATAALAAAVAGYVAYRAATLAAIVVTDGLSTAMAVLTAIMDVNPFVLAVTAIAALAAAIYALRNVTMQWGQDTVSVGSIVHALWDEIVDGFSQLVDAARTAFSVVSSSINGLLAPFGTTLSSLISGTLNAIETMINLWVGYQRSIMDVMTGLATTVADVFTTMIQGIADKTVALAQGLKDIATGGFLQGMDEVRTALQKDVAGDVFRKMGDDVDAVGAKIKQNFSTDYVGHFLDDMKKRAAGFEKASQANGGAGGNTDLPNNTKPGAPIDPQAERDRKRQDDALARFNKRLVDEVQALRGEANMLGMTTEARDRYIAQMNVEKSARDAGIANVQAAVDIYMKEYDAIQKLKQAYEANPLNGIQQGFQQFADDGAKLADNVASAWKNALDGISDNLADMATGGKADFASMLKDFGKQMLSASFKNIMTNGLKALHLDSFMPAVHASTAPIQTLTAATANITATTVTVTGAAISAGDAMPGLGPIGKVTRSPLPAIAALGSATNASGTMNLDNFGMSYLTPEIKGLLNAIKAPESGGRYNVRYTPSGGTSFDDTGLHPNIPEPGPAGPSTAAGAYQATYTTWKSIMGANTPITPANQDQFAIMDAARRMGTTPDGLQAYLARISHTREVHRGEESEKVVLQE